METFQVHNVNIGIIIFLALFSSAFGLFYYALLTGMYERNIKPGWITFVIPPCIVLLTSLIDKSYVPLACGINAPIIVLLMMGGPVYDVFVKKEGTFWELLIFFFGIPLIVITWPYGFALLFIYFIFRDAMKPSQKNLFYELQGVAHFENTVDGHGIGGGDR